MTGSGPPRGLLGQAGIYTLATASQVLSTVIVLPVVTRWLTAGEFGAVATSLIVMQGVTVLGGWGLPGAITRAYFTGSGVSNARSLLATTIAVGVATTALVYATGPLWSGLLFKSLDFRGSVSRGVLLGLGLLIVISTQALLRAEGSAVRFATTAAVNGLGGQLAGLAGLALSARPSPASYLNGMIVGSALAAVLGLIWTRPKFQAGQTLTIARWGLGIGLPVVPHMAALQVMNLGDRVVLERLSGLAAVGQYQVAYLVGSVGIVLMGAANNAWAPMIYAATDEERWSVLARSTEMITRLVTTLLVAIGLALPLGFAILAPADYATPDALIAAAVVAAATLPVSWYLANVHVLFQQGRTRRLAWGSPLSAGLNVFLNLLLIPRLGLVGAAGATAVAYIVQALLVQQAAARLAPVPWRIAPMIRGWGLALAGGFLAMLLPDGSNWPIARGAAALAIGAGTVVLVLRRDADLIGPGR